jgi:hypothetical protein
MRALTSTGKEAAPKIFHWLIVSFFWFSSASIINSSLRFLRPPCFRGAAMRRQAAGPPRAAPLSPRQLLLAGLLLGGLFPPASR